MQWNGQAIIINQKSFNEEKIICTVFSKDHGAFKGLVSINNKNRNLFQIGNLVDATWKARLPEHLGSFYFELLKPLPMLVLNDRFKLASVLSIMEIFNACLPEKIKEENLYYKLLSYLLSLKDHADWLVDYIDLEMHILKELGFALDLTSCAVTGETNNLIYVSPKSGRSVSAEAGKKYHDKLLKLPKFLLGEINYDKQDILAGLALCRFFINKNLYKIDNQSVPSYRIAFEELIETKYNLF